MSMWTRDNEKRYCIFFKWYFPLRFYCFSFMKLQLFNPIWVKRKELARVAGCSNNSFPTFLTSTFVHVSYDLDTFWLFINPLHAKDVYIRPGCTLISTELISFCRPRILKVFCIRRWVLHSVGQGHIYTSSIYAARSQQRIYTSFLYSFLKSFGL